MNNAIDAPSTIDSLSGFLKYGPTGLAGLLLILVIIALAAGTPTPPRERILMRFMYIGAFCFALSLAATFFSVAGAYPLYFRVIPLDMGSKHTLPLPIVKMNNTTLDDKMTYLVKSEVTAIVDVSDAIDFVQEVRSQSERQRQAISDYVAASTALVTDLQKVPQILNNNCSGGSNGIPAASNPSVIAITSRAVATIAGLKSSGSAAIAAPPPTVK
jgi:hypothetical protein